MTQTIPRNFTRAQNHLDNVQYAEDIFTYSTNFDALQGIPPQGRATANIQIENDSYFKWIKATYSAWTNTVSVGRTRGTRIIPIALVEITDSGSGRRLQSSPIPVDSVFGTGEFPFILPLPRIFLPRSTITLEVTNLAAIGQANLNLQLSLHGVKGFEG